MSFFPLAIVVPNTLVGEQMYVLLLFIAIAIALLLIWQPKLSRRLSLLLTLPFIGLATSFLINDTSILHVAANGGEDLPLRYRFAATWSAREGPIMLWAGLIGILMFFYARPFDKESEAAHLMRLRLISGFALTLLFISAMLDPFQKAPIGYWGNGLNVLLQTDLMVIHPPIIFLTYSFCVVLACIGLSAIWTDAEGIRKRVIQVARPAAFFASLGIGLGGLWAYTVLDWGGYWAWDPVETGSMLPWLVLVIILHLRTRPGKVPDHHWIGASLLAGIMAIFATLVTRAGGVWASSVHTFVTDLSSTTPDDVFGRLMVLRADSHSGVEIIIYLLLIVQVSAFWLCTRMQVKPHFAWLALMPATAFCGWMFGADLWLNIPGAFILLIGLAPLIEGFSRGKIEKSRMLIPISILILSILHGQVILGLFALVIAISFALEKEQLSAWGLAVAGVALHLAAAWGGMLSLIEAGAGMIIFIMPWLFDNSDSEIAFDFSSRKLQQRLALWAPVMMVTIYLVVTFVILISSIDQIQFAAHEVYGTPFIIMILLAMTAWSNRERPEIVRWLFVVPLLSLIVAYFFGERIGWDSSFLLTSTLSRGFFAILVLFPALIALPSVISLIEQSKGRRLSMSAHFVHLGLVLLIIGHLLSTTIVDRGDASHRVTLIRDEAVIFEGYELVFVDVITETEGLEIGAGYIGVRIEVREEGSGELIDIVEPGMLRFDHTDESGKLVLSSNARSEVDILQRYYGDLVFIMDGTQAGSLMRDGPDSADLVRITVYDLPGIHLVWFGWFLMLCGSLSTFAKSPARHL